MTKIVRLTESDLVNLVKRVMNEQSVGSKPVTPTKAPTTKIDAWKGFADYLVSSYDYKMDYQNKLTYTLDNKLTITITFTQYDENPAVGAIGMTITFIDPNIVKVNGPTISKIANTLGVKLVNNTIVANNPQGYLTQVINSVAKMLFNNVKIDGKTIAQIEGEKIKGNVMGAER